MTLQPRMSTGPWHDDAPTLLRACPPGVGRCRSLTIPSITARRAWPGLLAADPAAGQRTARVRLDIHTDDLDAEVARFSRLDARRVQRVHSWQVMRDPAGLIFCVIPDPLGTLHDGNANRWD